VSLTQNPPRKLPQAKLVHVIYIVALRQPSVAKVRKAAFHPLKELAPAVNLRFNLKKAAYMLVAAFKIDNGG
jgi:hypothetical protein